MENALYIDDLHVRSRFGCWITRGGYAGLLTFPAMREPEYNDWPEEDGIEVDLSEPKLEDKEIAIPFLADTHVGATDLVAYLSEPGYHSFYIPSLGRRWNLRLSSQSAGRVYPLATSFELKLVEDVPVRPVPETMPDPGVRPTESRYLLDGVPFSAYGVATDDTRASFLKSPTAKRNMDRTVSTEDGRIYDADHLVFQKKEVTFKCHFKAVSMEAFWKCYDAFFSALIQPEERKLYVEEIGKEYLCYYKNSSGFKILTMTGPVVVTFNLTLVFTMFRLYETDYFLATEAGDWIVTEDGEFFIDMK